MDQLKATRPRTCVKCRLHGKCSLLRGHRASCPFLHCCCALCSAHEKSKETCTITRNTEEDNTSSVQQPVFPELVLSTMDLAESSSRSQSKSVHQKREGKLFRKHVHFGVANYNFYALFNGVKYCALTSGYKLMKIFFFHILESKQKQLEKHKDLYSKINRYSSEIADKAPELSPLAVLRTAIQMHQQSPTQVGPSKQPVLMAPSLKSNQSRSMNDVEVNLKKLKEVLPNTPLSRLAALLNEENGNLESVITRVVMSEKDETEMEVLTRNETILDMEQQKEKALVSAVSVDTNVLKAILKNVNEDENTANNTKQVSEGKVLSFHKPETSTVQINKAPQDPHAMSLSNYVCGERKRVYCNSCTKTVDNSDNFNFCPYCGNLLRKNYRRL